MTTPTCQRDGCFNLCRTVRNQFCSVRCGNLARPRRPLSERFWEKVERAEGCWLWMGAHGLHGHGQIYIGSVTNLTSAHRISWLLHHGPIPDGLSVLHRCDNPPCVNPEHLFLGTQKDNMQDAIEKGRFKFLAPRRGPSNNKAKLTWTQVADIRSAYIGGVTLSQLSRDYSMARATLRRIVRGDGWRENVA